MRWCSLLLFLPLGALAQDPRIARGRESAASDPRHQASLYDAQPISTSDGGNPYWIAGKKLFKATILGQAPEEDVVKRDQQDRADGVERLTKENWNSLSDGDEDDVWAILVHGPPRDVIDRQYYDSHKNATRITRERYPGKVQHVHWARVDYMREAEICTKWILFRSPVLAIVSDRGRTVRWVPMVVIMQGGEGLYDLLASGNWLNIPVWDSRYAPGGDRAYLVDFYLSSSNWISTKTSQIPNLVWMGLFAALTQNVLKWMHTKPPNQSRIPGVTSASGSSGAMPATRTGNRGAERVDALRDSRSKGVKSD